MKQFPSAKGVRTNVRTLFLCERDGFPFYRDQPFLLHFLDFPHHCTAVNAKIIGKLEQGKGQGEAECACLGALDAEIAHQLAANGAVAEDIHLFCQRNHLVPHQAQHIFRHLCVMRAGIFAPLGDVVLFDEKNGAILFADGDEGILLVGKGECRPEHACFLQIFQ